MERQAIRSGARNEHYFNIAASDTIAMNGAPMTRTRPKFSGWRLGVSVIFLLLFLYAVRPILLPFVIAGAIAYVCSPLICWLMQKTNSPRWTIATGLYVLILGIATAIIWSTGAKLYHDAD